MVDQNAATTIPDSASSPSYVFALWNLIIRPPRSTYQVEQLGPDEFEVRGQRASRKDFRLKTRRGPQICCSHFIPRKRDGASLGKTPVIIYMHGNSSNRLEAGNLIPAIISRRIALFCFDAHGCGLSEGEYISLGWHERDDLATVIEYLRRPAGNAGAIGVWGRSMGAVTALMHADRDPSIAAMCVDSPFASMHDLVIELAQSEHVAVSVPTWLLEMVMSVVRSRVRVLADFDLDDLVPLNHVKKSYVPALFLHGREDTFIPPAHSEKLFSEYAGEAEMILVSGEHNTERGHDCVERVVNFFCRVFQHNVADPSRQHVVSEGRPNAIRHAAEHGALRGSSGANIRLGRSQSNISEEKEKTVTCDAEAAAADARRSGIEAAEIAAAAVLTAARADPHFARRSLEPDNIAFKLATESRRGPIAQAPSARSSVGSKRKPLAERKEDNIGHENILLKEKDTRKLAYAGKENMPSAENTTPQDSSSPGSKRQALGCLGRSSRASRTPAKKAATCKPGSPPPPPTPLTTLRLR